VLDYSKEVVEHEWPAMRAGGESDRALQLSERIVETALAAADGADEHHRVTADALGSITRSFIDDRRLRISMNHAGIPVPLWRGLILGAILTIAFCYLFGVESLRIQLLIIGILSSLIAVMFSMILVLDYPFRGNTGVPPEAWYIMRERMTELHLKP